MSAKTFVFAFLQYLRNTRRKTNVGQKLELKNNNLGNDHNIIFIYGQEMFVRILHFISNVNYQMQLERLVKFVS